MNHIHHCPELNSEKLLEGSASQAVGLPISGGSSAARADGVVWPCPSLGDITLGWAVHFGLGDILEQIVGCPGM